MMTDTRRIAEVLPTCVRRRLYQTPDGVRIQCKPKSSIEVAPETVIANPEYYKVRSVSVEDCYVCLGLELPDEVPSLALTPIPKEPPHIRRFRVEDDGSIVYERRKEDWEPPKDVEGFQRDQDDPWKFVSQWPECCHRSVQSNFAAGCGFVRLRMACTHPDLNIADGQLTYQKCCQCLKREIEEK